ATYNDNEVLPLEGVSLVTAIRGKGSPRKPLFWEHQGNRAVRDGSMKLVAAHKGEWELYDLSNDRAERNNLAATRPQEVRRLETAWNDWAKRCNVQPWPIKRKAKQELQNQ
ncbi:MAG: hypothetical protein KDB27_23580, partial [Planctomycetales bacterium]|nr:hypothetical protein [Planctomycetales bacterium]